jgi:hypothetical protein
MKHRPWTGYLLAAIGVLVLLFEVGLHFYGYFHHTEYELNHPVLYVAMVIGFVGFYMINPKGAEGGTDILTRTVVAVISVIRSGKATTAIQVTPVEQGKPVPEKTTTMEIPVPVPPAVPPVTPSKTDDESGK